MIIAGRDIDSGAGFSTIIHVGCGLPIFNIENNTVDNFADILIRITDMPLRYVIIIIMRHEEPPLL